MTKSRPRALASTISASLPDRTGDGYTLAVRANHRDDQGLYLYRSDTGQVEVYQHDTHSLFFFPGGGMDAAAQMGGGPNLPGRI